MTVQSLVLRTMFIGSWRGLDRVPDDCEELKSLSDKLESVSSILFWSISLSIMRKNFKVASWWQSWKTSAHACSWLFLVWLRLFHQWKFSPLNEVVLAADFLAITTFDKMELDEFWEQSNSTRSLWHTELISRECWLFSNSKAGKLWEALLDSHSATGWVGLSDFQTLLEQDKQLKFQST